MPVLLSYRKQSIDETVSVWGQHWHLMGQIHLIVEVKFGNTSYNPGNNILALSNNFV